MAIYLDPLWQQQGGSKSEGLAQMSFYQFFFFGQNVWKLSFNDRQSAVTNLFVNHRCRWFLGRFEIWSGMNPTPPRIQFCPIYICLTHKPADVTITTNQRYIGTLFGWKSVDLCDFLPRRLLPLPRPALPCGLKAPPVHPWFLCFHMSLHIACERKPLSYFCSP